jgi:uncharacterized damage-inducible protein DinB
MALKCARTPACNDPKRRNRHACRFRSDLPRFRNTLTPALLDGIVRVNRDTRVQTERRDRLLMHLFQHQIHHRGQAHAMLSATAIEPLDEFFSIAEAPLRAIEFDSLGWTEETVWGP